MRAAPALALAGLAIAASPAAADPGTLSGKLTDGKLPTAATGRAFVQAVNAQDGRIVAASRVEGGAWKLTALDPGLYMLTASVVRPDKVVSALAPLQRVRSGKTTRTKVSLKRTKTPKPKRKRKRRGARAAAASSPAVGVRAFTGSGPNSQLGRGMATMLIGELVDAGTSDCDPAVIEVMRRDALLQEIALSNSGLVDPRSRLRPHLIDPAYYVQGTVATTVTSATWDLQLVDAHGNVVGGHSGTADGMAIFDAPAQIAQALTDQLCDPDYQVTLLINATISVPPYFGSGIATADFRLTRVPGPPTMWMGQDPVIQSGLQYGGVPGCTVSPGGHSGYVRVEITKTAVPDQIQVVWGGETFNFTDLVCPGAGLIPNGVPPLMPFQQTQPGTFVLPAAGGTQNVSGALGGAWVNTGQFVVTRIPRSP